MAVVEVPGSKSITNRALFLAACADGTSVLHAPLHSDDTEAFALGLTALGYRVERTPEAWTVHGDPAGPPAREADVYCRDGATPARFLPALAALGHGTFRFDASAQMRRRPVGPLTTALRSLGVDVKHEQAEGYLPLTVTADGVEGGELRLDAGLSSQFLTALLLAAPLMTGGLTVTVTDLVSVPYVEMTLAMMRRFGVHAAHEGPVFRVPAGAYRPAEYLVEPDASTASYFLAAAAVTGRTATVPRLGRHSLQGDVRFAEILARMGADVRMGDDTVTVTGPERLAGVTANMRDISDTMPTLVAIAPFADGPVRIEDVYNTRVKECDRLDASAANLARLGVRVETGRDWIQIWPGTPSPAVIDTRGDHRLAMAFSITALRVPGITLDDPGCVRKTFPRFHETLARWVSSSR